MLALLWITQVSTLVYITQSFTHVKEKNDACYFMECPFTVYTISLAMLQRSLKKTGFDVEDL